MKAPASWAGGAIVAVLSVGGCGAEQTLPGSGGDGGRALGAGGARVVEGVGGASRRCLADTNSDIDHCGACDHPCAPGQRCESGACLCDVDAPPSFAADILPVLTSGVCANGKCHASIVPVADLDLTDAVYDQLVGVPAFECADERRLRVAPGKPEESYLVHKTNGVRLCAGSQMPPGQLLDEDVRRRISDWICIGALDD